MLVLTIKEDQNIRIGDDITVSFRHSYDYEKRSSKAIKLRIDAQADIKLLRQELIFTERVM